MKFLSLVILSLILGVATFAKDEALRSVEEFYKSTGDDPIYFCKGGKRAQYGKDNNYRDRCRNVPYEYEEISFLNSDEEEEAKKARNNINKIDWLLSTEGREYLKTHQNVSFYDNEILQDELKREKEKYEQKIKKFASKLKEAEAEIKDIEDESAAYKVSLKRYSDDLDKVMADHDKIREEHGADAMAHDSEFYVTKASTWPVIGRFFKDDPPEGQEEAVAARKEMARLQEIIKARQAKVDEAKKKVDSLSSKSDGIKERLDSEQNELDATKKRYHNKITSIYGDDRTGVPFLEEKRLKSQKKIQEANIDKLLKDIEDNSDFVAFLMRDYDSLKDKLKIGELELKLLMEHINGRVEKSILGKYIAEALEKNLKRSCEDARACSEGTPRPLGERETKTATDYDAFSNIIYKSQKSIAK